MARTFFRRVLLWTAALLATACDDTRAPALVPAQGSSITDSGGLDSQVAGAGKITDTTDTTDAPANLNGILKPYLSDHNVPAVAAAVFDSNRLLAGGAVGTVSFADTSAVVPEARWHLGSNTKAMTATLVATFIEADEFDWDTPIGELFSGATVDDGWSLVTVRHVVEHRGGLTGNIAQSYPETWSAWWAGGDVEILRAEFARMVLAAAPVGMVGEHEYANAGYILLGAALEALAAQPWERLMEQRLFGPLEMTGCGFGPPPVGNPVGHDAAGQVAQYADNPPALGPAGTVHCDLASWGKFLREHLRGPGGESTLLPAAQFATLHTPGDGEYAGGWIIANRPWAQGKALTHAGSNTWWYSVAWVAPNTQRVYVATTNSGREQAYVDVLDAIVANLVTTDY